MSVPPKTNISDTLISRVDARTLDRYANMLKAMAHPVRMAIIDLLDKNKRLSVTEIYEALSLEQAVASHHLGILRDKGILQSSREGKNTYYFLDSPQFVTILECIQSREE